MNRCSRIFAAIDSWETQECVTRKALTIAADNDADLLFGHMIELAPYEAAGLDYVSITEDTLRRITACINSVIQEMCINDSEFIVPRFDIQTCFGRSAEVLRTSLIDPFSPELIICSTNRLSGVARALSGSFSSALSHRVSCDVLIVNNQRNTPE